MNFFTHWITVVLLSCWLCHYIIRLWEKIYIYDGLLYNSFFAIKVGVGVAAIGYFVWEYVKLFTTSMACSIIIVQAPYNL